MNVASLELCKELYELSGWDETKYYWHSLISHDMKRWSEFRLQEYKPDSDFGMRVIPAYDLGYLLRKLPDHTSIYKSVRVSGVQYWAEERSYSIETEYYDTPEDAAAKLCIELFKQGILAKELPNEHTN